MLVEASGGEPALARSPVIVVSASTYWRNAWKYQARAYRHCFWDAGTLHANLLAVATSERLQPSIVVGFADRPVEQLLGLDVAKEGALTLVALGSSDAPPQAPAPLHDLALDTEPLSRSEVDYPAIREMHAASSLATGADAAVWRKAPCVRPLPAVKGRCLSADPLPAEKLPVESLESVIRRRGSTRAFERGSSLSLAELSTALERASAPLPTDFSAAPSTALVDLYLIVHAVEGVPAGAYFYSSERGALELLREGDFRVTAGRLGLHQQLPADAAVNVYCLTDLEAVLEARGNRGYRAVQLEGGIRGGLLYLAAYALRFGATGLTFLDDEVIEFFSPHARGKSVIFLTALGRSVRQR